MTGKGLTLPDLGPDKDNVHLETNKAQKSRKPTGEYQIEHENFPAESLLEGEAKMT